MKKFYTIHTIMNIVMAFLAMAFIVRKSTIK